MNVFREIWLKLGDEGVEKKKLTLNASADFQAPRGQRLES